MPPAARCRAVRHGANVPLTRPDRRLSKADALSGGGSAGNANAIGSASSCADEPKAAAAASLRVTDTLQPVRETRRRLLPQ
jgi:hypothetical protein